MKKNHIQCSCGATHHRNTTCLLGKRFGRLLVVKSLGSHKFECGAKLSLWECLCDCGKTSAITAPSLTRKSQPTRSCGCLVVETMKERSTTHGYNTKYGNQSPEYRRFIAYGIRPEEFDDLFERQNGLCAICRNEFKGTKDTHVDHDHNTGMVRGLLCGNCNVGIGNLMDDADLLRNAADYLDSF